MVRPSSRAGVPVLSRPSASPRSRNLRGKAQRRRLADAAGRNLRLADMDEPAQERPVVSTTAAARSRSALGDNARHLPVLER